MTLHRIHKVSSRICFPTIEKCTDSSCVNGLCHKNIKKTISITHVFQQDRASSPTSKVIQAYLEDATPESIIKDEWPPQSPDCNPIDYGMGLSELKKKVYQGVTKQALNERICHGNRHQ